MMPLMTEEQVRAALCHTPLLDAEDYRLITAQANADPDEGPEWLPYYKLALAVLATAFGMVDAVAGLTLPADSPAARRRDAVVRKARDLFKLSNVVCAVGPTGSLDALARAHEFNAALDADCPLPVIAEGGAE